MQISRQSSSKKSTKIVKFKKVAQLEDRLPRFSLDSLTCSKEFYKNLAKLSFKGKKYIQPSCSQYRAFLDKFEPQEDNYDSKKRIKTTPNNFYTKNGLKVKNSQTSLKNSGSESELPYKIIKTDSVFLTRIPSPIFSGPNKKRYKKRSNSFTKLKFTKNIKISIETESYFFFYKNPI